jgi:8-oxo-dGTP pyrophosphatase MutT (NUDIX family)
MTINDDKHIPARSAGIVIVRKDERGNPLVLLLKTYNSHDLPKGHIEDDDGDSLEDQILNAAIRECYEECGFTVRTDYSVKLDPRRSVARLIPDIEQPIRCVAYDKKTDEIKKVVYLFIAETECPAAIIKKNKKTGIYEHHGFKWARGAEIVKSGLHEYLQQGVLDALDMYMQKLRVDEAVKTIISYS